MSLWDRYFAPGDVRSQHQALALQHARAEQQAVQEAVTSPPRPKALRVDAATRARRQHGLLIGGLMFTALSVLVTRRAVARKISISPATATGPVDGAAPSVAGGLDAAQALSLATLNVFSVGTLAVGVAAKAMDIADVEDLRDKVRKGVGYDVYGGDAKADKELEEWVTEVLLSKDSGILGLRESVAAKLAELQKLDDEKRQQDLKK